MKDPLDVFSTQSNSYKKFRPTYPKAFYLEVLAHVLHRGNCWDCGTGNGQVAIALSAYFNSIVATDISAAQLQYAPEHSAIAYKVERAEKTSFSDNTFDLITVAQALHWFDFEAFNKEVRRVSKNGGIIAVWGYGLLRIDTVLNERIDFFYTKTVGPYWNTERRHIDNAYHNIPFDFERIAADQDRSIRVVWDLQHFKGYLDSWSSVQNYRRLHLGKDPVKKFIASIEPLWGRNEKKEIQFPIFSKLGRITK